MNQVLTFFLFWPGRCIWVPGYCQVCLVNISWQVHNMLGTYRACACCRLRSEAQRLDKSRAAALVGVSRNV